MRVMTLTETLAHAKAWAIANSVDVPRAVQEAQAWHNLRTSPFSDEVFELEQLLAHTNLRGRTPKQVLVLVMRIASGSIRHSCGMSEWPVSEYDATERHVYVQGCLACSVMQEAEGLVGNADRPTAVAEAGIPPQAPRHGDLVLDHLPGSPERLVLSSTRRGGTMEILNSSVHARFNLSTDHLKRLLLRLEDLVGASSGHAPSAFAGQPVLEQERAQRSEARVRELEQQLESIATYLERLPLNAQTAQQISQCRRVLASEN